MMPGGGPGTMWLILTALALALAVLASVWLAHTAHHGGEPGHRTAPLNPAGAAEAALPPSDTFRASDADREKAVAALQAHTSAGRIPLDELDERVAAVYASRTIGELRRVLADLPGRHVRA